MSLISTRKASNTGIAKSAVACEYCRTKKIKCDANQPCGSCVNHRRKDCYFQPATIRPRRSAKEKQRQLQERLDRAQDLLRAAGIDQELDLPNEARRTLSSQNNVADGSCGDLATNQAQPMFSSFYTHSDTLDPAQKHRDNLPNQKSQDTSVEGQDCPGGANGTDIQQLRHLSTERLSPVGYIGQAATSFYSQQQPNTGVLSPVQFPSPTATHNDQSKTAEAMNNTEVIEPIEKPRAPQQWSPSPAYDSSQPPGNKRMQLHFSDILVADSGNVPNDANQQLLSPAVTVPERPESPTQAEHHGPGSYLSICSPAAVQWVVGRTGASNFVTSAASLASYISKSLKLQQKSQHERVAEPDSSTAWEYSQAFFEESAEAAMNLVQRDTFEARLRAHLEDPESDSDDLIWYSLRNIIYAFGARILTYKDAQPTSWLEAQRHSWVYFQNAFSVYSDLIFSWSSVAAIQALFVMALFVEGIGVPKLEYMLVSSAMRLAQARGLASAQQSSKLPDNEIQYRRVLFWSIYVAEKHISFRARRPSAIDDDYIDCPLPTIPLDGYEARVEFLRQAALHAQISSAVMKERLSIASRHKSPLLQIEMINNLEKRLNDWHDSLPVYLKPQIPVKCNNLPPGVLLEHKLWIQFSYYATLSAIHSNFTCPWNPPNLDTDDNGAIQAQIDQSMRITAEVARKTILATRNITIDAAAPIWLTFLFPLMAMLSLFTYVLNDPTASTVNSDIDLLDMAAGHFGYVGFSTLSPLAVLFAKNIAHWTRAAVAIGSNLQQHVPGINEYIAGETFGDICDLGVNDNEMEGWSSFFSV